MNRPVSTTPAGRKMEGSIKFQLPKARNKPRIIRLVEAIVISNAGQLKRDSDSFYFILKFLSPLLSWLAFYLSMPTSAKFFSVSEPLAIFPQSELVIFESFKSWLFAVLQTS